MTHFLVLVLVDDAFDDIEEAVTKLLEPYDENNEWFREGSKWDWWVIGGRFQGSLDGYDPTTDPRNLELCQYCDGGVTTQRIADEYPAYQSHVGEICIQCKGATKVVKWDWVDYPGDIAPVASLSIPNIEVPHAIVTPDGKWHQVGQAGWFGHIDAEKEDEDWAEEVRALLTEHIAATAVVVDCHV